MPLYRRIACASDWAGLLRRGPQAFSAVPQVPVLLTRLGCRAGSLKPFSTMPAPPQTFLLGNLPDLTKSSCGRMQFHLVRAQHCQQHTLVL